VVDSAMNRVALVCTGTEKLSKDILSTCVWIEARIDIFLASYSIDSLLPWLTELRTFSSGNLIGTVRLFSEQCPARKRFTGKERYRIFKKIMPFVDLLDIEAMSSLALPMIAEAHNAKKRVIFSYHDFQRTPSNTRLQRILSFSLKQGADIVKVAARVNNSHDLFRLLSFTFSASSRNEVVVTPMGTDPLGRLSPLLFGSLFTYAAFGEPTAPGQLDWKETLSLLQRIK